MAGGVVLAGAAADAVVARLSPATSIVSSAGRRRFLMSCSFRCAGTHTSSPVATDANATCKGVLRDAYAALTRSSCGSSQTCVFPTRRMDVGLAVELRVQLGAEEDRPRGVVQPEKQHDAAGERAVR